MSCSPIEWGDPAVIVHVIALLRQKLRKCFWWIDEHLMEEAIEDAVLDHKRYPERFDASRGVSLSYYLALCARSYLFTRLRQVKRRRKHEKAVGVSETIFENLEKKCREKGLGGVSSVERNESEQKSEDREDDQAQEAILDVLVAQLKPRDQIGARLLHEGASCEEWVRHLRIEKLPHEKQQHKIDAEKDRLRKLLRRRVRKLQGVSPKPEFGFEQLVLKRTESANHGRNC